LSCLGLPAGRCEREALPSPVAARLMVAYRSEGCIVPRQYVVGLFWVYVLWACWLSPAPLAAIRPRRPALRPRSPLPAHPAPWAMVPANPTHNGPFSACCWWADLFSCSCPNGSPKSSLDSRQRPYIAASIQWPVAGRRFACSAVGRRPTRRKPGSPRRTRFTRRPFPQASAIAVPGYRLPATGSAFILRAMAKRSAAKGQLASFMNASTQSPRLLAYCR
jgi:hypothetical protein